MNISQIFIKSSYRVAVWAIVNPNTEGKIAVPYTFNARFPKLWRSQRQFDNERQVCENDYSYLYGEIAVYYFLLMILVDGEAEVELTNQH